MAALMSPMTVTPPKSVDTQILTSKITPQEMFFDKTTLSKKYASDININIDNGLISKSGSEALVENTQAEITVEPASNTKKVKLVKGKRNAQSMDLLTVLLMLKERRQ